MGVCPSFKPRDSPSCWTRPAGMRRERLTLGWRCGRRPLEGAERPDMWDQRETRFLSRDDWRGVAWSSTTCEEWSIEWIVMSWQMGEPEGKRLFASFPFMAWWGFVMCWATKWSSVLVLFRRFTHQSYITVLPAIPGLAPTQSSASAPQYWSPIAVSILQLRPPIPFADAPQYRPAATLALPVMKAMQFSKASQAWLALFCDCPLCLYFLTSLQTLPVCFCSLLVHRLVSFWSGPAIHIKFSTSPLDDNSYFSCPLSSYRLFLMCLRSALSA